MRAVVVDGSGAFVLTEVGRPAPGPGQVLVEVSVSGVNFMDAHQYRRAQAANPGSPFHAGVEGVGTVVELGQQVTDLAVGQRVGWLSGGQGSFADYTAVDSGMAVPIPDDVDDATAAALLMQGVTAHYLATDAYPIRTGDPVVVHAAAGGVGQFLTQIAKIRGGFVIATVSTPEKAPTARAAGADHVVGYDGFAEAARRLTHDEGVAAVYDSIGAATFDASIAALRARGTLVVYGGASGPAPALDLSRLSLGGSLTVVAPMVVDYIRTPQELRSRTADLVAWAADGRLSVNIGGRYPLAEAGAAVTALTSRTSTGKILLLH